MQPSDTQIRQFGKEGHLFFPDTFGAAEVGVLKSAASEAYVLEPLADDTPAEPVA